MPVCAGQLQNQLLTNGLCLMLQGCKKDDRATVFENGRITVGCNSALQL